MARAKKEARPVTTAQRLGGVLKACRDIMRKDKGLNGDVDRLPMLTWIMFLKFLDDWNESGATRPRWRENRLAPSSTLLTAGGIGTPPTPTPRTAACTTR